MLKTAFFSVLVFSGFVIAGTLQPDGLWQFDDPGNLTQSTVGSDLVEVGTHTAVAGMVSGDGAVEDPPGSYFICTHGIGPNGGGSYVNNWTLLLDVKMPTSSLGHWLCFFQTNTSNANDGDCFISPAERIGVADTGYSTNTLQAEVWRRIVISCSNQNFYRIFVDGSKWLEGTAQPLDGRFSLDPTILLFADENGEDYPIHCSNAAIWGQALTDPQVSSLGDPSNPIQISAENYAGMNLLLNPSGEEDLAGWTIAGGNDWQATDRTDWHFPLTGNYYFTPGRTAGGEIAQTLNVEFIASEIDSGTVIAQAGGYLGGGDEDRGRILVEYLDADDALLATTDSGWTAGPAGSDWLALTVPDANGLLIPSGTRSVRYRFLAERLEGTDCDAYGEDFFWEYKFAAGSNQDPQVPSITAPAAGSVGVNIAFTFVSADPDADQVSYQIDWGDEVSGWSDFQASGTNFVVSNAWSVLGIYPVRVRSRDTNGGLSSWSAPFEITISGEAAGVFKSQPYLQNVSPEAITIAWETDRVVFPRVDWGLTVSYGNQAEGLCIEAGAGVYICKVRIAGLAGQTQYHFRARNGSTLGSDAVFQTAPDTQTPFSFSIWGDSQQETANPACSNAMFSDMAAAVDFGVAVGDVVQDSGYSYFSNPFRKYLCDIFARQKPAFVAFGNHDEPAASLVHKAIQNSGMHSFSFNYGNAHFTCIDYSQLNDNTLPDDGWINSLPIDWLQEDLSSDEAQNAAWRFLFIHVPPYCERWFSGSLLLQTYLVPLMNQYRVQFCFSGHTHEYERGFLNGTYYVITGCGSYLDTVERVVKDWPHMTVGGAQDIGPFIGGCVNGYTIVDISGTELTLTQHAYNADGSYYGVIDAVHVLQADFTGNGLVNLEDFSVLARAWQTTEQDADWNPACDLADRESRIIDINDLAVFVQYWQFQ